MSTLPYGSDASVWAWVLCIGLVTAFLIRQVSPAYALGGFVKVILLGLVGAVVGAVSAEALALYVPSPAVVVLCAWAGSLVLLDLNHLICRRVR